MELTQVYLKTILSYDPETGIFIWLIRPCKNIAPRTIAGSERADGYRLITLGCWREYAHRLAFVYMLDDCPSMVDHINRNPRDNRWDNLRPTNHSENGINTGLRVDNTSGAKGVVKDKRTGKYYARLHRAGKTKHLGTFSTINEAVEASHRAAGSAAT
jgi:hypothetical protein